MKTLNGIKFLIFDLGNVIYDIDYSLTFNKLNSRLQESDHELGKKFMVSDTHFNLEMGKISEEIFRNGVREYFKQDWDDAWIDEIWNALLVDIPMDRIQLLLRLKQQYKLYLLSNTNSIHFKIVEQVFRQKLDDTEWSMLFDKVFLSHEMGLRKPSEEIYREVVRQIGGEAHECLFFDDLPENLKGAEKVGMKTYHIDQPTALIRFFEDVQ
ncbi:MAG: HAD-IA family hydrolase [Alphaproteobacteria bacterium]|nr:HAD-IA family hydrolase [Alphaproteobacteria bacterium]